MELLPSKDMVIISLIDRKIGSDSIRKIHTTVKYLEQFDFKAYIGHAFA